MQRGITRRQTLIWCGAVVAATSFGVGLKYGRHHVWPKRFAVVEPGQVYRSGLLEAGPLEEVLREHRIHTVLTLLTEEPDAADQLQELGILRRNNVKVIRIPMPGSGCADFALLDRAAAAIADQSNQPLLVHCEAGLQRTGASVAAWRMLHCGWSLEQALQEGDRQGLSIRSNEPLMAHLRSYASKQGLASKASTQPDAH